MKLMVYREENFETSHFNIGLEPVESDESKRKKYRKHLKNEFGLDVHINKISLKDRLISDIGINDISFDFTKNQAIIFNFSHEGLPVTESGILGITMDLKTPEFIEYILISDLSEQMKKKLNIPKVIHLFGKRKDYEEEIKIIILKANIHDIGPERNVMGEVFNGLKDFVKSLKKNKK